MGHVQDRWMDLGPNGRKVRSPRWGKGNRWRARWIERGAERSKSFPTRDAAEYHLAQIATGSKSSQQELTIREFAGVWLPGQLHYAESSRLGVELRLAKMVMPHLGDSLLSEVTRADVQRMVILWAKSYSAATIHQCYSFLTTMYASAVRDGFVKATPCAGVNLPKVSRVRVVPLTVQQVMQLAEQIAPRHRSMVVVGAATGMRGGELRGLTWDRVFSEDVLIDRQLTQDRHGRLQLSDPKSYSSSRRLALGQVGRAALDRHRSEFPSESFVWTSRQGGPMDREVARRAWARASAGMDLRSRSGWHELRHHHASILIAAGMSPAAVAERLGHADPAETLRTYAHLWPADHARMTAVTDAALAGLVGPSGAVAYLPKRTG